VEELDIEFTDRDGATRRLTLSGGFVTQVPERGQPADDFIAPAAEALKRAKAQGRNRIEAA
jgi:PleD family two-component response regulator